MIKYGIVGLVAVLAVIACDGSDVTRPPDANDYDAIYHIITIDRTSEFNLNLLDFSIPDTLLPGLDQIRIDHFWFNLVNDSLDLPIDIDYPDTQDSLGTLPEAFARVVKSFSGTFEVIGVDTADGGQVPFRLSKEFVIRGEITAEFRKFGGDTNYRRGWLLTEISDASFIASYPGGITQIRISSDSYPDHIVATSLKSLDDVLEFAPGESLTITINGTNIDDVFRIRIPGDDGFHTVTIEPDNNNIVTGFSVPGTGQYNHFLVEAIGETSFIGTNIVRYEAVGVLFKVE